MVPFLLFLLLAWGTWVAWKDIELGRGWICRFFPQKARVWLNQKKHLWAKLLLTLLLGYITAGLKMVEWIITLALRMVDGSLFR